MPLPQVLALAGVPPEQQGFFQDHLYRREDLAHLLLVDEHRDGSLRLYVRQRELEFWLDLIHSLVEFLRGGYVAGAQQHPADVTARYEHNPAEDDLDFEEDDDDDLEDEDYDGLEEDEADESGEDALDPESVSGEDSDDGSERPNAA